jgi:hypothetical protein
MPHTKMDQDTATRTLRGYFLSRAANRIETGRKKPTLFSEGGLELREALRVLDANNFVRLEAWIGRLTDFSEAQLEQKRVLAKQKKAARKATKEAQKENLQAA